jgi:hypothetical protein
VEAEGERYGLPTVREQEADWAAVDPKKKRKEKARATATKGRER